MIEFLDTEWFEYWVPATRRDRWRWAANGSSAVTVPTSMIVALMQPDRLRMIRDESLVELTASVKQYGFLEPLTVVVDMLGRAVLKDGHHRMLVCELLEIGRVPVWFNQSERIRVQGGLPMATLIGELVHTVKR